MCSLLAIGCQPRTSGGTLDRSNLLTRPAHQINGVSHFSNDLGLDSLDTVEVVMAIEEVRVRVLFLGKDRRSAGF